MYKSTTFVVLGDEKFAPGSKFTKKQLQEAGQSKENIDQLEDTGVLSKDMDAELHPDHQPIEITLPTAVSSIWLSGSDIGVGNG